MDILKTLLPLAEAGFKMYLSGKIVQKSAERAKEVAIRGSVLLFGLIALFIFSVAAILMVFIDLGTQFEAQNVHFSGVMLSALFLTFFGLFIFLSCFIATKIMEKQEQKQKAIAPIENHPYATLMIFGEQFIKTLIMQLNEKPASEKSTHA